MILPYTRTFLAPLCKDTDLTVRYLHTKILLFRSTFSQHCRRSIPTSRTTEFNISPAGSHDGNPLYSSFAQQCSIACIQAAIDLVDLIHFSTYSDVSGAWWYNTFCIASPSFRQRKCLTIYRSVHLCNGFNSCRAFSVCPRCSASNGNRTLLAAMREFAETYWLHRRACWAVHQHSSRHAAAALFNYRYGWVIRSLIWSWLFYLLRKSKRSPCNVSTVIYCKSDGIPESWSSCPTLPANVRYGCLAKTWDVG